MKTLLTVMLCLPMLGTGQARIPSEFIHPIYSGDKIYESIWTTTVEFVGDTTCLHEWRMPPPEDIFSQTITSCSVLHDELGCPNNWGRIERICERCLRKEVEHESRKFTKIYLEIKRVQSKERSAYEILQKKVEEQNKREKKP